MLNVHVRINDSTTGQPTPVRLRISSDAGATYAPLGRTAEFPVGRNEAVGGHLKIGGERWCYIDGSCEVPLPSGQPLRIQATKGPEFQPIDEPVTLGPGQLSLRFAINRAFDWRAAGYYPGDTRCHFLAPRAGLLEAMAEDLDIANGLAIPFTMLALDGNTYTTVPELLAFSGQEPALTAPPRHIFTVNTMNAHPVLGKVALLHAHRTIFPLTFGGPEETDDWSIGDWCGQCHRKGGLTVWVDAFEPAAKLIGGEALVAALLGEIDAIEIDPGPRTRPLLPWLYRLWNAGAFVPLVGASGKDSNRIALGAMRTYAHVENEFGLAAWIESIRQGRTFATTGPLIDLQVNGQRPGGLVNTSGELAIAVTVESLQPFDQLELLAGGEVIHSVPGLTQPITARSLTLQHSCQIERTTWIAARCIGKAALAHTSLVRIRVNDRPFATEERAAEALQRLIDETGEWVKLHGRYANAKRREQVLNRCARARDRLAKESVSSA